jgi:hypothetical protein
LLKINKKQACGEAEFWILSKSSSRCGIFCKAKKQAANILYQKQISCSGIVLGL